jgi:hypothetical protein
MTADDGEDGGPRSAAAPFGWSLAIVVSWVGVEGCSEEKR